MTRIRCIFKLLALHGDGSLNDDERAPIAATRNRDGTYCVSEEALSLPDAGVLIGRYLRIGHDLHIVTVLSGSSGGPWTVTTDRLRGRVPPSASELRSGKEHRKVG